MPGSNLDVHKGVRNTGNGKMKVIMKVFFLILNHLKDNWLSKAKILHDCKFIRYAKVKCVTTIAKHEREQM